MRVKTYTAETAHEALKRVREELGEAAVIVSTETDRGAGMTVITAALDERAESNQMSYDPVLEQPASEPPPESVLSELADASATLRQVLSRHGVPPHLGARIVTAAVPDAGRDLIDALDEGLRVLYRFNPLGTAPAGAPVMLVGPPGVGKTVTVAKMAARAAMAGMKPAVITTDTVRAGAVGQLEAFTRILGIDLATARSIADLEAVLDSAGDGPVLIDTAGTNPFDDDALDASALAAQSIGAEPLLVLAAGGDAIEAAEIAAAFARIGCRRMLATRIDLTRRLGSLLAAADAGRLAFSDVSVTPDVADGLNPLESHMLARLLTGAPAHPASKA